MQLLFTFLLKSTKFHDYNSVYLQRMLFDWSIMPPSLSGHYSSSNGRLCPLLSSDIILVDWSSRKYPAELYMSYSLRTIDTTC